MRINLLIALVLLMSGCNTKSKKQYDISGEWNGKDVDGKPITLILNPDSTAYWVSNNIVLGDVVKEDHQKEVLKYRVNMDTIPHQLDFYFSNNVQKKQLIGIDGIFRFLSDTRIELRINYAGAREKSFYSQKADNVTTRLKEDVETLILSRNTNKQ